MKRTLSLILAALLLASSMTACGEGTPKETQKSAETSVTETKAPETDAPDTDPAETTAPTSVYAYDTSLVTENGAAKAHIVISEGASATEKFAAEELAYHVKTVSGADISIVNAAAEDSLPIVIATPDSLPELETLFADDLNWLRTLGEVGDTERYGDDGFAIRTHEGKIYIFGATSRGALNGVYDFIEENLGVLWIRADMSKGLVYDEMPTVTVAKTDYREKSPFQVRGVSRYGASSDPASMDLLYSRNKFNCGAAHAGVWVDAFTREAAVGLEPMVSNHNVKWWLTASPIYDPNITEYWETLPDGTPMDSSSSRQVNYWSELTADTVAASVIHQLDLYHDSLGLRHVGVCMEDLGFVNGVFPAQNEPFEYAPGQFVNPEDEGYLSTVYFAFINRVARQVAEKYPDALVNTYAYTFSSTPPRCELEDNVIAVFCHYTEDLTMETLDTISGESSAQNYNMFKGWVDTTTNIINYNYYGCYYASGWYERPYWYRLQNDFQYYAEHGMVGMTPAIYNDDGNPFTLMNIDWGFTFDDIWSMNILTHWLYAKLSWNPYEDVEALIVEFCDKVYGGASEHMQEYYRLVRIGWEDGAEFLPTQFNSVYMWNAYPLTYFDNFIDIEVDGVYILEAIQETLEKAWEAADDRAKEYIGRPRECFADPEAHLSFEKLS